MEVEIAVAPFSEATGEPEAGFPAKPNPILPNSGVAPLVPAGLRSADSL